MKPRTKAVIPGNRGYPANRCVKTFALTLLLINSFSVWAGGVVTNPTEADLRAALVGGGNVSFECDGTIYLADSLMITNATSITSTGRNITLSGSNSVRVLVVNPEVDLTLSFLKVQGGKASYGAGLWNNGGTVTANNCDFSFNTVAGTNGLPTAYTNEPPHGESAFGGAVFNTGSFNASNSTFVSNSVTGGNGANGSYNDSQSLGAAMTRGGSAIGGAVFSSGSVTLFGCALSNNATRAGKGGDDLTPLSGGALFGGNGGLAFGGVIYASNVVTLVSCAFRSNSATAGNGGSIIMAALAVKPVAAPFMEFPRPCRQPIVSSV